MRDLKLILQNLQVAGWCTEEGTVSDVEAELGRYSASPIPVRQGDSVVATLQATPREKAHPRSLSAIVGLGEQPLHTDGAHLRNPPDVIVLSAESASPTPTLLCKSGYGSGPQFNGIFTIDAGNDTFLRAARDAKGLRYDPGCMFPADSLARKAATEFQEMRSKAFEFHWEKPQTLLFIANRRMLHARAGIEPGDEGRSISRLAFNLERRSK